MPCPMVGHVFTNRTGWKRRSSEWILFFVCPILSFIYTLGFHDVSCICEISSDEFGVHLQKWSCRLCGMPAHWCRPHTLSPPKATTERRDDSWQADLKRLAVNRAALPIHSPNKAVGGSYVKRVQGCKRNTYRFLKPK